MNKVIIDFLNRYEDLDYLYLNDKQYQKYKKIKNEYEIVRNKLIMIYLLNK